MQRESSLGLEDESTNPDGVVGGGYEPEDGDDDSANLPPGRMHATTSLSDIRLKGGAGAAGTMSLPSFSIAPSSGDSVASTSSGGSHGSGGGGPGGRHKLHARSLDQLPPPLSPRSLGKSTRPSTAATAMDGNSSISSLEDIVDSDILYDRAGLLDQDASSIKSKENNKEKTSSFNNLPPVHERLSEDTLEDTHAFSDLKVPTHTSTGSTTSRANSITTAENDKLFLDPLVEEDEDEGENGDGVDTDEPQPGAVILTNLEKLSLQANSGGANNALSVDATGDDSLAVGASTLADLSEAPSEK